MKKNDLEWQKHIDEADAFLEDVKNSRPVGYYKKETALMDELESKFKNDDNAAVFAMVRSEIEQGPREGEFGINIRANRNLLNRLDYYKVFEFLVAISLCLGDKQNGAKW